MVLANVSEQDRIECRVGHSEPEVCGRGARRGVLMGLGEDGEH
jgi:hypothetical protein